MYNIFDNKIVRLISPSSACDQDIGAIADFIVSHGFSVQYPKFTDDGTIPYHSGGDDQRFADLKDALLGDASILWALRGGYGATRLIEALSDIELPAKQSKVIVGFSDITALHLFFYIKFRWRGIHGKVLGQIGQGDESHDVIFDILNNVSTSTINDLRASNQRAKLSNEISGVMIGGNLSVFCCSLGTMWQPDTEDAILFFEDVSERGYSIDRMLEHLRQAGIVQKAKAIVFGQFTGGDEPDGANYVEFAIERFSEAIQAPVFRSNCFGHGQENLPIIIGAIGSIVKHDKSFVLTSDLDSVVTR